MKENDMMQLIEDEWETTTAAQFKSVDEAVKVACSVLKYLYEQCEYEEVIDDE